MRQISFKKNSFKVISILSILFFSLQFSFVSFAAETTPTIQSNFELVESVPKDTIYGEPNVRRAQQVWLDMINSSKKTIDLGAFYFATQPNSAMEPVIEALKNAANRGVKVRIILDGQFYSQSLPSIKSLLNVPNIEIRQIPMNDLTGGIMHAKYMVIDHNDSFVGSQNFDWRALEHIHEIGVRIRSQKLAETILKIFNLDWKLCETKNITTHSYLLTLKSWITPVTEERPIILFNNHHSLIIHPAFSPKVLLPNGLDWEQDQFVELLKHAQHKVEMQVLEYSPEMGYGHKGYWGVLDNAIREAAARGVKINLIVSNWALKKPSINYLESLASVPNVTIKYSAIPLYKGKFIPFARVEHCKYMVVDNDLSWVGTGNWTWSYFNNTRNIAIIMKGYEPNHLLQNIFKRDWNGPYVHQILPGKVYKFVSYSKPPLEQ